MPVLPRLGRGQVIPLERASPAHFGTGRGDVALGGAIEDVSEDIARISVASTEAKRARLELDATRAMRAAAEAYQQDEDYETAEERFEADREKVLGPFRDQLPSAAQAEFDLNTAKTWDHEQARLRHHVMARQADRSAADYFGTLDGYAEFAKSASSPAERQRWLEKAAEETGRAVATQAITAVQGQAALSKLEEIVRQETDRQDQQRITEEILEQHPGNLKAQLAEAHERLSGEQEDGVVQRLKVREVERQAALQQQTEAVWASFWESPGEFAESDIPGWMQGQDRASLTKAVRDYQTDTLEAASTSVFQDLVDLRVKRPGEFEAMNLWEVRGQLTKQHFDELQEAQGELRRGIGKPPDPKPIFTRMVRARRRVEDELGLSKNPRDAVVDRIYQMQKAQEALPGATPLTESEFDDLVGRALEEYVIDEGVLWNSKVRLYEIDELPEWREMDVPAEHREALETLYRERSGISPDENLLKQFYRSWLLRRRLGQEGPLETD